MRISPWILGAALLVPATGALAGAKLIKAEPVGTAEALAALPQQPFHPSRVERLTSQERLPDHYAMETPEGRVEVGELAWRGRYASRVRYADDYDPRRGYASLDARWDRIEVARSNRAMMDYNSSVAAAALDAAQPSVPQDERITRAEHRHAALAAREAAAVASEARAIVATSDSAAQPQLAANDAPVANPGSRVIDVQAVLAGQSEQ